VAANTIELASLYTYILESSGFTLETAALYHTDLKPFTRISEGNTEVLPSVTEE